LANPVVTINDQSLKYDTAVKIAPWIAYSDADGNPATKYQFWDSGTAVDSGYFSAPGVAHQPANTVLEVSAANLSKVVVHAGSVGGSETMWVRAFDGTAWSNWDTFTLTTLPNAHPVATVADHSIQTGGSIHITKWLSYTDTEGSPATKYQFWDSGSGADSGYFSGPGVAHHPANTVLEVKARDLSKVVVHGGSAAGAETLWVRAFDGKDWGNWDTFTLTTRVPIIGTNAADIIDGVHTPPGQPVATAQDDFIFGGRGGDTISSLGGNDLLAGGRGKDTMSGGTGTDNFDFNLKSESRKGAAHDVITDFSGVDAGELDRIDLSGIDAKSGPGNQHFHFIGSAKFHHRPGELHVLDKGAFFMVEGDIDGNGRADFQIEVHSVAALAKADFIL
jgi:Ca2+-binding RTX toxin-like protein